MDGTDTSIFGDVRTWFFFILGILLTLVAYVMRGDRQRLDVCESRLNAHAQRLTALDGEKEDTIR